MPLELSRIRALCFDVDGTLSDTDDAWVYALAHFLRVVRRLFPDGDPSSFSRWVVMGIESPANFIYGIPDRLHIDAPLEKLSASFSSTLSRLGWGVRPHQYWLIPQARQTVETLSQRYPLAVVSARNARGTLAFLSQYDLQPFFKVIATSQTCSHTKPYPDPVLWAARQMGVPPQACLMIGDSTVDIRAGKAAGAQAVGVLSGFGSEHELRQAGADLVLPNVAMLPEVLTGICFPLPGRLDDACSQPVTLGVAQGEQEMG